MPIYFSMTRQFEGGRPLSQTEWQSAHAPTTLHASDAQFWPIVSGFYFARRLGLHDVSTRVDREECGDGPRVHETDGQSTNADWAPARD